MPADPETCAHASIVRLTDHLFGVDRMNCLDCEGYRFQTVDGWGPWSWRAEPAGHDHSWSDWTPWTPDVTGNGVPVEVRERSCLTCVAFGYPEPVSERQIDYDPADVPERPRDA